MEKKQMLNPLGLKSSGTRMFMLLIISLFWFTSNAQNSSNATGEDYYQAYMVKYPASPLVKMYQNNPAIGQSYQAMRYAVILDNPKNFSDFGKEELQHMQKELDKLMVDIENIDAMVQKGESYERAADIHTRQMMGKQHMDEQTRGGRVNETTSPTSTTPFLSAPKQ